MFTLNEKKEEFYPLKGLDNVGLTCYMNSTLQCLLHIPELNNYFINIYPDQKDKLNKINFDAETKGRLSNEYHKVVKGICSDSSKKFSPRNFNDMLARLNPQFSKFESNDSKDLLLYLFQSIHEELNYLGDKKLNNIPKCNQLIEQDSLNFFFLVNMNLNFSIISYLFYGVIKSYTLCTICNSTLYNFQYFQFLSFPAYNYDGELFNIYKGFKEYIKTENMIGDNQCYCQKCQKLSNAKVCSRIFYTPPYLIINIDYGKNKKYKPKKVIFGESIDLEGFTDKLCNEKSYELIAVSTHIGRSGDSGHYIAYCKIKNKKWYKFNDSWVNECDFKEVNSNSPYLLIFRRIKNEMIK